MATTRVSKRRTASKSSPITKWIVGGAILLALVVLAFAIINNRSASSVSAEQPDVPAEWINGRTLGNPDAPVTVSVWEDFLCPACAQWNQQVKPTLFEEYIQPGTVKLEYNYFPLNSHEPGASMGAMAAECASDQGVFWPYHDRLFAAARSQGQAGFQYADLQGYAQNLGMDEDDFGDCMNSLRHQGTVVSSVTQATQLGLSSTPSVIVNNQQMSQPFNLQEMAQLIESAQ